MDAHLITIFNTHFAASSMLNFDKSFIQHHMKPDADVFINDLKLALSEYRQPIHHNRPRITIDLFDLSLKRLLNATRNLYAILNNEAKQQLADLLAQHSLSSSIKLNSSFVAAENLAHD